MFWVNEMESELLPISDRATQYGDGFFTTMKVIEKHILFWDLHLKRLETSAKRLGITEPNWKALEVKLNDIASTLMSGGIKILVSRGSGGRGYAPEGCVDTQVIISTFPLPVPYEQWKNQGIGLGVSSIQLGLNPLLAGMKHLNRLEQVLIKQSLAQTNECDAIVLDINQHIIETSIGNVFWVKNGRIFTPDLSEAGVQGVMKAHIEVIAKQYEIEIVIVKANLHELQMADEVFISNSLFEIVPINRIGNTYYTKHTLTHWFQEKLYSC